MNATADAATPAQLLAAVVASDAARPRLTWYDDVDGPTRGERIELSGRVLQTWVAKAANLLVDDLGVERGDAVALQLPVHWRAAYWSFAAWRIGAVVVSHGPADVLVTDHATPQAVAAHTVAVSLPALARRWSGGADGVSPLPLGAVDEAAELATYGDVFEPLDDPDPDDDAMGGRTASELVSDARRLAAQQGWSPRERVAVLCPPGASPTDVLTTLLGAWSVDGSVVLVRGASPAPDDGRLAAERVTSACGPTGMPAARS